MVEYDYQEVRDTVRSFLEVRCHKILTQCQMKAAAKSARANLVYYAKHSATDIFNNIPIPYSTFGSQYNRIGDELCLHLLGYDKKKQRYAQCPEILYPIGQGGKADSNVFQALALVKV